MFKPNGLIKISGDGLENKEVLDYLREFSRKYSTVIIVGGGSDINEAFKRRGYSIDFCPMGRIMETLEERQLARNMLEKNQAKFQDQLDEKGIIARVEIPFREIGTVSCPENGDLTVLSGYIGFDKIVIFTREKMVKKKKSWLKKVAKVFSHIGKGELDKIEVRGF
ncbi:MAG: hypothetical protein Q7T50_01800 [Candidatus Magasanikbacteria bacterium]|nr:hypothetical protein [Candidatus Magasanikbacteria bacterium]